MREATAIRIPADGALPQLARLLDVDAVRQAIAPMLADDRGIAGIRVTYIRYRPRKRVLVGYEVGPRRSSSSRRPPPIGALPRGSRVERASHSPKSP